MSAAAATCRTARARAARAPIRRWPNNQNLESSGYPITLVVRGQRAMPPFGDMMNDDQVAAVVNYLRTHFGNNYRDAVTAQRRQGRATLNDNGGEDEMASDACCWPQPCLTGSMRGARRSRSGIRFPIRPFRSRRPSRSRAPPRPIMSAARCRRPSTRMPIRKRRRLWRHQDPDRRRAQPDQGNPGRARPYHGRRRQDAGVSGAQPVRADGFQGLHGGLHAVLRRQPAQSAGALGASASPRSPIPASWSRSR